MGRREAILQELEDMPEPMLDRLLIIARQMKREEPSLGLQTYLASEPVLRRAWDHPEEDEAWKDL